MWRGFTTIATNLGNSIEGMTLFIGFCAGLIFYAKDVKLGIITHLLISASLFVYFYEAGMNYTPSLVLMLIAFILLTLQLLAVRKNVAGGAVV